MRRKKKKKRLRKSLREIIPRRSGPLLLLPVRRRRIRRSSVLRGFQPLHEKKTENARGKGHEVVKPTKSAQVDAPTHTVQVTSTTGGGASSGGAGGSMSQTPIGPKDTLGDIYYKTYTEEARGDAPHRAPWGLKQARSHDALYHAYVVGEAITRAANHQIVREWRTMVKERGDLEKYRERKTKFELEKKYEEWGRGGLRSKLQAAEDLLSKERAEWKKVCEKDNQRMYAARSKIMDLEAQVDNLKGKVEEGQADRDCVEVELKAQVSSKDKDLTAKDAEIAELKRRLHDQTDKNESLEIDLEAEIVKVATAEEDKQKAEEARDISTSALNIAQNNYSEAKGIVDPLVSKAEWMRGRDG
ncbi:putative intermediate filament, rod domain, coil 1B [Helianthus anomalus]